jgi:hypothetical protein
MAVRDGTVFWSGPVWTVEEQGVSGNVTVTAQGWLKLLDKRVLRSKTAFNDKTPSEIAFGLLGIANGQGATSITQGSFFVIIENGVTVGEIRRNRTYEQFSSIGGEIAAMSQVENGYDIRVDPVTRVLDLYVKYQRDMTTAVFGFGGDTLQNTSDAGRRIDASELCNRFTAVGKFGSFVAEDGTSQAKYGIFEETGTLSDVANPTVLGAYAGVEVALRSEPRQTYTIEPKQWKSGSNVPRLFLDYDVGDIVYFSIDRGRFSVAKQGVRVFAVTVNIDEQGGEKVTNMQFSPSS